jgi:hypothetical protein
MTTLEPLKAITINGAVSYKGRRHQVTGYHLHKPIAYIIPAPKPLDPDWYDDGIIISVPFDELFVWKGGK